MVGSCQCQLPRFRGVAAVLHTRSVIGNDYVSNQCCQVQVDKLLTHSVLNLAAGYYTHRRTYTEIGLQVI